jgi:hypothetical protein
MAVSNPLTATRRRLDDDRSEAGRLVELAAEELSAVNAELRELARGLYPVALAERGLHGGRSSR